MFPLYINGFKTRFDFILNFDAASIEVTTRYLYCIFNIILRSYYTNLCIFSLDLVSSLGNSLNILERTAATYFIIFIVNQLFMSDNDVIELGWLECEFFASEKSKWDGVLFKVGDKFCSTGLIEFSGGCNDRTPNCKNQHDVTKFC